MTAASPACPAWRTASHRLFAGMLALLFTWASMPAAIPIAAPTPVLHIAPAVHGGTAIRDGAKLGQPTARTAPTRTHAGPDGSPPPALPTRVSRIGATAPVARAGWSTIAVPPLPRRTGEFYSARAPPRPS